MVFSPVSGAGRQLLLSSTETTVLFDGSGNPDGTDGLEITQGQGLERMREEEGKREGMGSEREWELGFGQSPARGGPESIAITG